MLNTKTVKDFINDTVAWVDSYESAEGGDNIYTSKKGELTVTVRPEGVSA